MLGVEEGYRLLVYKRGEEPSHHIIRVPSFIITITIAQTKRPSLEHLHEYNIP